MCHLDAINPNSSIWMKQRYHSIQTMWRNLANMSGVNITRIMVFEYMKIGPIWFTTATILRRLLNLTPTSIQTGFFITRSTITHICVPASNLVFLVRIDFSYPYVRLFWLRTGYTTYTSIISLEAVKAGLHMLMQYKKQQRWITKITMMINTCAFYL